MFIFKRTLDGTTPVYEKVLLSNVSIAAGTLVYNASGYATNATAATCTTDTVIGVQEYAVDNSGGSAGDKSADILMSPAAVFEVDTTGTPTQAQVWTAVDLGATCLLIDEDDPKTTKAGVCRIIKLVSGTNKKVLVSINRNAPADS